MPTGDAELRLTPADPRGSLTVLLEDLSYGLSPQNVALGPGGGDDGSRALVLPLARSFGWYDLMVRVPGEPGFAQRLSGRIESGRESFSDPAMGNARA
jgi:phospholipase C